LINGNEMSIASRFCAFYTNPNITGDCFLRPSRWGWNSCVREFSPLPNDGKCLEILIRLVLPLLIALAFIPSVMLVPLGLIIKGLANCCYRPAIPTRIIPDKKDYSPPPQIFDPPPPIQDPPLSGAITTPSAPPSDAPDEARQEGQMGEHTVTFTPPEKPATPPPVRQKKGKGKRRSKKGKAPEAPPPPIDPFKELQGSRNARALPQFVENTEIRLGGSNQAIGFVAQEKVRFLDELNKELTDIKYDSPEEILKLLDYYKEEMERFNKHQLGHIPALFPRRPIILSLFAEEDILAAQIEYCRKLSREPLSSAPAIQELTNALQGDKENYIKLFFIHLKYQGKRAISFEVSESAFRAFPTLVELIRNDVQKMQQDAVVAAYVETLNAKKVSDLETIFITNFIAAINNINDRFINPLRNAIEPINNETAFEELHEVMLKDFSIGKEEFLKAIHDNDSTLFKLLIALRQNNCSFLPVGQEFDSCLQKYPQHLKLCYERLRSRLIAIRGIDGLPDVVRSAQTPADQLCGYLQTVEPAALNEEIRLINEATGNMETVKFIENHEILDELYLALLPQDFFKGRQNAKQDKEACLSEFKRGFQPDNNKFLGLLWIIININPSCQLFTDIVCELIKMDEHLLSKEEDDYHNHTTIAIHIYNVLCGRDAGNIPKETLDLAIREHSLVCKAFRTKADKVATKLGTSAPIIHFSEQDNDPLHAKKAHEAEIARVQAENERRGEAEAKRLQELENRRSGRTPSQISDEEMARQLQEQEQENLRGQGGHGNRGRGNGRRY